MHVHFTMSNAATSVGLLTAGGALAYVAGRRGWRPPLWAALSVGLALRVLLLLLTHAIKPYDIYYDYHAAGLAVLHHQDPILHARQSGWSFLPAYAFVLAGEIVFQHVVHTSWLYAGRSFAILADLAVIALVGVIAGRQNGALRRFQYACYPLAVIDAAGRMDITCLALSLAALVLVLHQRAPVSGRRALGAGALLGLAVGVNSWPLLFLPALWRSLPSARTRVQATAGVGAVVGGLFLTMPLTVGTPVRDLPGDARTILTYHGTIGTWGWSAAVVNIFRIHWYSPLGLAIGTVASLVALAAVLGAAWWWRRGHPLDLASAIICAFLVTTASFGGQFLLWPAPTLLARPPKRAWWYHTSVNVWSILALGILAFPGHTRHIANTALTEASLLVVPAIIGAMPWQRRSASRAAPAPRVPRPRVPRPGARAPVAGAPAVTASAETRDRPRWRPGRASGSLRPCPGCRS